MCIGYKLVAAILLNRLKQAGAEKRIWNTQFGFKSGSGTADALFAVRRLVDSICGSADSSAIFLALDWAKACDSISPSGLSAALKRFGIPQSFIDIIGSIYGHQQFFVADSEATSCYHSQYFGISQGCPLSPFLFIILMSVLMTDARRLLQERNDINLSADLPLHELLYADDTLLIDTYGPHLQEFMDIVAELGREYGLKLNWSKVECLPIQCEAVLKDPDGKRLKEKDCITYLGALISNNGTIDSELARRLGMASTELKKLRVTWNHSGIGLFRKIRIYMSCVVSKLLYGLQTIWLTKFQKSKLNGFHCRSLRPIAGILPSFLNHASNAEVMQRLGSFPLSNLLLE